MSLRTRAAALCLLALATSPAWARGPYMVCLQPLGEHDGSLLAPIARGLEQAYGLPVRRLAPRPLPTSAWYPPRSRYRAQKLLDHLQADVLPAHAECTAVVAFTSVDVSMTKGAHVDWGVLGLSYLRGRVGVVSTFRMRRNADRALLARRATKVVLHEFGHVLGLPHRSEGPTCLMNDAGGAVATIDRAAGTLCPGERADAERMLGRKLPPRAVLDWDAILRK